MHDPLRENTDARPATAVDSYSSAVSRVLDGIRQTQGEKLETGARWLSETLQGENLIYITGSGHSHMIAEEIFYRAGGLAAVSPILEPGLMLHEGAVKSTHMERVPDLAGVILEDAGITSDDLLVIASNSGRNAFPVEMTLEARRIGCRTIAITSIEHSSRVPSRHKTGRKLFELADLVIDNTVPYGDASVRLANFDTFVGPVSSIAGIFIINSIVVRGIELMVEAGVDPDVFVSANIEEDETSQGPDLAYWQRRIKIL